MSTKHTITATPLPRSTRAYIRENKARIRRAFGRDSAQEQEFLTWVLEQREQKHKRLVSAGVIEQ